MNNAGIGAGALRAMDFYDKGDKRNKWVWNKDKHTWDAIKEYDITDEHWEDSPNIIIPEENNR